MSAAYFGGQPIFGPRGPAGPDGNPIGTVLPYMGLTAPTDYLICDGATYDIADYSDLAKFFEVQFGSSNFFGGDGETTFAVPNMKDLFLRGYNPNEDGLSGELGEKQEATEIPTVFPNGGANGSFGVMTSDKTKPNPPINVDSYKQPITGRYISTAAQGEFIIPSKFPFGNYYSSRPVNMAVNFIIKATNTQPILDEYDTDDGWHVRKWSDGYVEMALTKSVSLKESSYTSWAIGLYQANVLHGFNDTKLPIELSQKYTESCGVTPVIGTLGWVMPIPLDVTTATHCNQYQIIRPATYHGTAILYVTVTGRWK